MAQRDDRVSAIWDKTKKRSDRVSAIWDPVKERYDKVKGIWTPSYRGEIPATVQKMGGHWPDTYYWYGDSNHFSTSADANGINFSYGYTNPTGAQGHDYSSVIISGMPTQSSVATDLVKCAASIPVTFSRTATGDATLFLMSADGTDEVLVTATASGTQAANSVLNGTNPTTIPAAHASGGDITYDFRLMLAVWLDGYETVSASFTIPWSAFTWLPTGQPLIYQP